MIKYYCLNCNTKSINYNYIKKHKQKNNHIIKNMCIFCKQEYNKEHHGKCLGITILLLSSII